jgi:hypothetical protein
VSSISEAQERNEKNTHEMHIRLRDLKSAEAEMHKIKLERDYLKEECETFKSRVREVMLEKLGAERRLSETAAKIARSEVSLSLKRNVFDLPNRVHLMPCSRGLKHRSLSLRVQREQSKSSS